MKHIFILRLIRKEDGSLISERDMDTMAEKDKDEAVNELNGNSVGYLGYQKQAGYCSIRTKSKEVC